MGDVVQKHYKHVLLTSIGLHPQIITEIIYFVSQQKSAIQFEEIHVITTEVGLKQIQTYLLDQENGFFYKLCQEYNLTQTDLQPQHIQLLKNASGDALEDIQTVADNEVVANTITETVRVLKTAQAQINFAEKVIVCNDIPLPLTPIQFAWYSWLLTRARRQGTEQGAIWVRSDHHLEFLEFFQQLYGPFFAAFERTERAQ